MKHYTAIKESKISNTVVREINAAVLTATFPAKKGTFEADLYGSPNECKTIVYKGSCAPANSLYLETVLITI